MSETTIGYTPDDLIEAGSAINEASQAGCSNEDQLALLGLVPYTRDGAAARVTRLMDSEAADMVGHSIVKGALPFELGPTVVSMLVAAQLRALLVGITMAERKAGLR